MINFLTNVMGRQNISIISITWKYTSWVFSIEVENVQSTFIYQIQI